MVVSRLNFTYSELKVDVSILEGGELPLPRAIVLDSEEDVLHIT